MRDNYNSQKNAYLLLEQHIFYSYISHTSSQPTKQRKVIPGSLRTELYSETRGKRGGLAMGNKASFLLGGWAQVTDLQ